MAGSVVGAGTWTEKAGAETTINLPLPVGAISGDRVIAGWTLNSAALVGTQSGWTTIAEISSTGDTLAPSAWLGRKTLNGTDITNGFVTLPTIPSAVGSGGAIVYRGYETTQDFTAVELDKTSTATGAFAFGAQTITEAGVLAVYLCAQNTVQADVFTPASSYTETGDRVAGRNATMGYRIYSAAGSSGAITPTSGANARGVGVLAAFRATPEVNNARFAGFF